MTNDTETQLYSHHIFLFPFSWNYFGSSQSKYPTFESRTSLELIRSHLDKKKWKYLDFANDPINYYNDYVFFHTSAREAVFGQPVTGLGDKVYPMVLNFQMINATSGIYEIKIKKNEVPFKLVIDKIRLNLYDTGIGILSFFLNNHSHPDWQEILEINDYGRRIYPQFLDTGAQDKKGGSLLDATRDAFLAEKITVKNEDDNIIFEEDFESVAGLFSKSNQARVEWPLLSNQLVGKLLGDIFTTQKEEEPYILVEPIIDDRMFVVSWFGNDQEASSLKANYLDPKSADKWMQYIFVDNSGNSCQSERMRRELLEKHSYDRWLDYGTLYGISRYSMVVISGNNDFTKKHLVNHVRGRYFELVQLCLAQRASCLRFSAEITALSGEKDERKMNKEADFLYREYLRFINKVYFREATPQEQGIELYDRLQANMDIKEEVSMLNQELTDLFEFLSLKENSAQSKAANLFAWVATIFLPASLVASIFGFSTISDNISFWGIRPEWNFWIPLCLTLFVLGLSWLFLRRGTK